MLSIIICLVMAAIGARLSAGCRHSRSKMPDDIQ